MARIIKFDATSTGATIQIDSNPADTYTSKQIALELDVEVLPDDKWLCVNFKNDKKLYNTAADVIKSNGVTATGTATQIRTKLMSEVFNSIGGTVSDVFTAEQIAALKTLADNVNS